MEEYKDKNWIGSTFESITSGFSKMLASIKKHGWKATLFTLVGISLLWSVVLNPIRIGDLVNESWQNMLKKEKQDKDIMIERRYQANEIVGDIMSRLLLRFGCNRVLLLEKHNSIQSLGNVDFLYVSCTLEMLDNDPEIDYISEDLQRQMVVNLLGNDVLGLLKHSKYLYFDDLQNYRRSQCRLLNKLKEVEEKQCIIYPFCDSKHRPLLIHVVC